MADLSDRLDRIIGISTTLVLSELLGSLSIYPEILQTECTSLVSSVVLENVSSYTYKLSQGVEKCRETCENLRNCTTTLETSEHENYTRNELRWNQGHVRSPA